MAYSTNPNLPKARAIALKLLLVDQLPLLVVADRCGVHRSTLWRWRQKWHRLNHRAQLTNDNRPAREVGRQFRLTGRRWLIPTESSRPHGHAHAISDEVVAQVLVVRAQLQRCIQKELFFYRGKNV
jgi:transposase-like protein